MSVIIETTIGDITVDLFLKERPNTCLNFLKLCKMKYYNFCLFYKVERNFVAQSGDPTTTGRGGESVFSFLYGEQAKYFDSELKPRLKHEKMGTLSMVNNGNNMSGSQFFLTLGENLTYLDEVHTVFGEVTEGFDILLKLNEAICDANNRPYQDIRITHTVILHDPYDDPAGLDVPDASPEPTKEMLETDYIAPDEEIDDTKGKNMEELEEKIKDSEAKARATILEMVGDIPDADVKPPENVLFVCKLNPVTESKDLELIFSRFGPITSCEVIKDRKSGESLQYAFIEFENEEDCENAYFKMDNVLIDDRRIHVDFSQSVSKLNWDQKVNFARGKKNQASNLKIKESLKSDGYEMIFDMNSDYRKNKKLDKSTKVYPNHKSSKYKDNNSYRKEKSKYSLTETSEKSSHKRYRSRSPIYHDSRKNTSETLDKNSRYRDRSSSSDRNNFDNRKSCSDSFNKKRHTKHGYDMSPPPKRNNKYSDSEQKSSNYHSKKSTSKSSLYNRENSSSPGRKRQYYDQKHSIKSYKSTKRSKNYDSSDGDNYYSHKKSTSSYSKQYDKQEDPISKYQAKKATSKSSHQNRERSSSPETERQYYDKKNSSNSYKISKYDKKYNSSDEDQLDKKSSSNYSSKYEKKEETTSYRKKKRNTSPVQELRSVSPDYKITKKLHSKKSEIHSKQLKKKKSKHTKQHSSRKKSKKHQSSSSSDSSYSSSDSEVDLHKSKSDNSHKKISTTKHRSKRSSS